MYIALDTNWTLEEAIPMLVAAGEDMKRAAPMQPGNPFTVHRGGLAKPVVVPETAAGPSETKPAA
jgi:hypothetical protein